MSRLVAASTPKRTMRWGSITRHFLHVGENLAQRLAAADDLIGANQRTDLLAQVFGFDRQRANFLLGLQPLIHISEYEGVERLAFEIETRQRRFRLKTAAVIVGRRETTGNPKIPLSVGPRV